MLQVPNYLEQRWRLVGRGIGWWTVDDLSVWIQLRAGKTQGFSCHSCVLKLVCIGEMDEGVADYRISSASNADTRGETTNDRQSCH